MISEHFRVAVQTLFLKLRASISRGDSSYGVKKSPNTFSESGSKIAVCIISDVDSVVPLTRKDTVERVVEDLDVAVCVVLPLESLTMDNVPHQRLDQ